MTLLEKTRKINKLLQRSENVEYDGISRVLSNVLQANIYIAGKRGELFGYALGDEDDDTLGGEVTGLIVSTRRRPIPSSKEESFRP